MSQHYSTCNRCRAVRNEKKLVRVAGRTDHRHTGWVCRSEAQCDRTKNWQPRPGVEQFVGPTAAERIAKRWAQ